MLQPKLLITPYSITPSSATSGHILDMSGRAAFALCIEGEFTIKILKEQYVVRGHCVFACMPFVNVELVEVAKESKVIFGQIPIADLPMMINRWVNIDNLITIQSQPLAMVTYSQFEHLMTSVRLYADECRELELNPSSRMSRQIQKDIIDMQGSLILAQVLKIYFTNLPMEMVTHTHRDLIFQQFMLSLYGNFREHRDVNYYATNSGVSVKYFSTLVRQLSGKTPSQWIEAVVTDEAKTLLSEKQRPIKEIAALLKFPDAPTFTKYFQRVTGLTPKAFRLSLDQ